MHSASSLARIERAAQAWLDAYEQMQRAQAPLRAAVIEAPELRDDVLAVLLAMDRATPSWKVVHDELRELAVKLEKAGARGLLDALAKQFENTPLAGAFKGSL